MEGERGRVRERGRGMAANFGNRVQDNSVRYVAQENILPIKPQVAGPLKALAGKYFKRFDPEEGRFVSNVRHEFPDD